MTKQERAKIIMRELHRLFPRAGMMLRYRTHFELLVAVILSAQCTDKMVNIVTAKLFQKYPTLDSYVAADPEEFEQDIHATGFFRMKTKHILATARMIKETFGGEVPRTMCELMTLPGVARKTANVVLGNAFGIVEGIAVDTHVRRLSRVLGLSKEHDPDKIEQDLMCLFPRDAWFVLTYRLIEYGRTYCKARPHDHASCPLTHILEG